MINRLIYIVGILLCSVSASYGGNLLKGSVKDEQGNRLVGAIIEIIDLKTGAAADTNGNYQINNLPKGNYLVEVHLLSYATINKMVTIDGPTAQDFVLKESVIEKNGVVVTGLSLATEERKSITPIQSVGLSQLHENAYSNVIDAVSNLPGVTAVTTGPSVSKPIIRGLGYNRIITLNDGVRQEGQQWGDEHGIEIDDYNVTRIEVLKGPASLAYGSDALAGVVNIISNPEVPVGKIVGNVTTNYQTNNGLAAFHGNISGNEDGWSWKAYGTLKFAHDYQNSNDGYVYDTRFANTDFGASMGINRSWGSSRLAYTSFNEVTGIPTGARDSATGMFLKDAAINGIDSLVLVTRNDNRGYNMVTPYQHIYHQKLVWNNNVYLGNGGRLEGILAYQRNTRMEFDNVLHPDDPGLSLELRTITYDLKYHLPNWRGWQVTTGLNGMTQWNFNKGSEFLIPDYDMFDGGAYMMGKKDWDKWSIAGGIRYDFRSLEVFAKDNIAQLKGGTVYQQFQSFIDNFSNISGSLGAGYSASDNVMLKFNFSSGFRAPNVAELSANGVHDGTFRFEIGNANLEPEHSYQADLGASINYDNFLVNIAVFDNYIYNFIYVRKTDSTPIFNNPMQYTGYKYTQGAANLYGGELYIDYHPKNLEWLHFENTVSYVRGMLVEAVEGNNNLPYMPPARWITEIRAVKKSYGNMLKNIYFKVGLDNNSAQHNVFTPYGTETPIGGYTLLDAGVGADIINRKHKNVCTLTLAGLNLMDVAYQNSLSRLRYAPENFATGNMGIYNMGRNMSIMASFPLEFK
jgi:iron complex outermembrane recepter protein